MPARRHSPGRGSQLTPDEIHEIRVDYLCSGLTRVDLATKYGRTRNTIARYLDGAEFEEVRRTVDLEKRSEFRRLMMSKMDDAARQWELSMSTGAERGNHKPSRDWLLHAGVIDPIDATDTGPKVVVQIGVSAADVKVGIQAGASDVRFRAGSQT